MTTYFDKSLSSCKKLVLMKRHEPEEIADPVPLSKRSQGTLVVAHIYFRAIHSRWL